VRERESEQGKKRVKGREGERAREKENEIEKEREITKGGGGTFDTSRKGAACAGRLKIRRTCVAVYYRALQCVVVCCSDAAVRCSVL